MTRLKLAVVGDGKMGRAVASLAEDHGFDIAAVLGEAQVLPGGITKALLGGADVAIEFSVPAHAAANVRGCVAAGCPVVSGTTGWDAERPVVEAEVLRQNGALLWSPNFSLGVHIFARVVEHATRLMREAGAPGSTRRSSKPITSAKLDAPSGTARMIAQRMAKPLGHEPPVASVRTGSVPGTHQVIFDAPFEQVRIEHIARARDRRVFAAGALVAAQWIVGKRGVFTLDDMLGGSS